MKAVVSDRSHLLYGTYSERVVQNAWRQLPETEHANIAADGKRVALQGDSEARLRKQSTKSHASHDGAIRDKSAKKLIDGGEVLHITEFNVIIAAQEGGPFRYQ